MTYQAIAKEEQYFVDQVKPLLKKNEVIEASGYFKPSFKTLGNSSLGKTVSIALSGSFALLLTSERLLCVRTDVPAFSTPLLQNKQVYSIPLSDLQNVTKTSHSLTINSKSVPFRFEPQEKNGFFPSQALLVERLAMLAPADPVVEESRKLTQEYLQYIWDQKLPRLP